MPKTKKTKADLEAELERVRAQKGETIRAATDLQLEVNALKEKLAELSAPSDKSWVFQGQRLVETAPGRLCAVAPRGE